MHVVESIARAGGIAHVGRIRSDGLSQDAIERATRRGVVLRLRRGWYALPEGDEKARRLVSLGARLGCVSALAACGVWTVATSTRHVEVPRGTRIPRAGLTVHWCDTRGALPFETDPVTALGRAMRCLPRDEAVVALDSALNRGLLSESTARWLAAGSRRAERVVAACDPAAESGLESLARLRLRSRGIQVRSQVPIHDVGRVDLLLGDRLVLELDGEMWHSSPASVRRDRQRDRKLAVEGYLVLRFGYDDLMHRWAEAEEQILALIRARRHRMPRTRLRS